ncbi:hypothetical protein MBRU_16975 [Mycolicibacterium brumae DSM 44177]|nr:hypothetical protein MBRU_16975 [Mycolicibacterium brumae DSM 44177]
MSKRTMTAAIVGFLVITGATVGVGHADPADDALAQLQELSRTAEQTNEAVNAAQDDLDAKLAAQTAAEQQRDSDAAALQTAQTKLAGYQTSVDEFAVATYMSGQTGELGAVLTATSPQGLIDQLSLQRVIGTQLATTMADFRAAREDTIKAAAASAESAAQAKTAADQAATVRAGLMEKQSELQRKIAVVRAQYEQLTPQQRVQLADPGPVPAGPEVLAAPAPGLPEAVPPVDNPANPAAPEAIPPGDVAAPLPTSSGHGGIVVQAALSKIGSPYAWGGTGPGAFDCSGLVNWAYHQAGIGLPRSSYALAANGTPVSRDELQPGDVVNHYGDASHSSIYIGDGMVVHASTYGVPVRVVPLDAAGPFFNARRY